MVGNWGKLLSKKYGNPTTKCAYFGTRAILCVKFRIKRDTNGTKYKSFSPISYNNFFYEQLTFNSIFSKFPNPYQHMTKFPFPYQYMTLKCFSEQQLPSKTYILENTHIFFIKILASALSNWVTYKKNNITYYNNAYYINCIIGTQPGHATQYEICVF